MAEQDWEEVARSLVVGVRGCYKPSDGYLIEALATKFKSVYEEGQRAAQATKASDVTMSLTFAEAQAIMAVLMETRQLRVAGGEFAGLFRADEAFEKAQGED